MLEKFHEIFCITTYRAALSVVSSYQSERRCENVTGIKDALG